MLRQMLTGAAAGALGTVALNATTYLDMAARGRGASSMPAQTAQRLADEAGVDLGTGGGDAPDETAQNRAQGLGALMGYVTGIGVGAAYGMLRSGKDVPVPAASLFLGGGAMAGSNVPMTMLGLTDPREWPASSWVMDIVPHVIYGLVTAAAYEAMTDPVRGH